jgi:hypothetical protein
VRGTQVIGANSRSDRALPSPSPAANLVGIWKGNRSGTMTAAFASGFFLPNRRLLSLTVTS